MSESTTGRKLELNLKELRKENGLTQKELAKRFGCSTATLSKIENGKMPIPYEFVDVIARLMFPEIDFDAKEDDENREVAMNRETDPVKDIKQEAPENEEEIISVISDSAEDEEVYVTKSAIDNVSAEEYSEDEEDDYNPEDDEDDELFADLFNDLPDTEGLSFEDLKSRFGMDIKDIKNRKSEDTEPKEVQEEKAEENIRAEKELPAATTPEKDAEEAPAETKKKMNIEMLPIGDYIVYTDGSCLKNPSGPGGYGVQIIDANTGSLVAELSRGYRSTTNNRMEIMGVLAAFSRIPKGSRVHLYTDSKYVADIMTAKNKFSKNADLWNHLLKLKDGIKYRVSWVKGHAENEHNNRCDELARTAASQNTNSLKEDAGYVSEGQVSLAQLAESMAPPTEKGARR